MREALSIHQITSALTVLKDGERAVKFLEAVDRREFPAPQLIILDLNLPKVSGRELLERIRSSVLYADIPVVILSSSGAERDREDARRLGATRYIKKPSDLAEFMSIGAEIRMLL